MDQELKQRLIGAAVVTALAAIFIPMLFDDPVDESGQMVSELAIPAPPAAGSGDSANKLPASAAEVTSGSSPIEPSERAGGTNGSTPELPLQPSEKIDQDEAIIEETGQPDDEQQWIEESSGEEEPQHLAEDNGSDDSPESPISEDTGVPEPVLTPDKKSSASDAAGEQQKPVKKEITEAGSVKSPSKKPASDLAPAAPAATAKKPKADETLSKARLVRWYIQAGSFGKKENALSRQEALRKQGLPVFLETQATDKGTLYRLKIGPELDKKRAIAIRDKLNKQNVKTIILAE